MNRIYRITTEIRYVPDPSFIDNRGSFVKKLIENGFKDWRLDENRIEIRNPNGLIFISYSNLGFSTLKKSELSKFSEKFDQVLKIIGDIPPVRWGARLVTLTPSQKSFENLLRQYKNKLLVIPSRLSGENLELKDMAISYIFEKDHNKYHLTSGPMEKTQAKEIFSLEKNLPKNGIWTDLDIYREGELFYKGDFTRSRISSFVTKAFEEGEKMIDEFEEELNG